MAVDRISGERHLTPDGSEQGTHDSMFTGKDEVVAGLANRLHRSLDERHDVIPATVSLLSFIKGFKESMPLSSGRSGIGDSQMTEKLADFRTRESGILPDLIDRGRLCVSPGRTGAERFNTEPISGTKSGQFRIIAGR